MKQPKPITIDFETWGIEKRPDYPPVPVGVSIKHPGKKAKYYSWGHSSKNNCKKSDALKALKKVWKNKEGLLFQNGKFDIDVAEVHMCLPMPAWDKIHDTVFLLFLDDPQDVYNTNFSLKPSAERLLNLPPDEQDEVRDWLVKNQPVEGIKIGPSKKSKHPYGAYINYAPGDLVGRYANGDTERTEAVFNLLYKKTVDRGMLEAYDRERRLMPILLEMERQGVPVNLKKLRSDVKLYNGFRDKINAWIIKTLKAPTDINLNSGPQLINAMVTAKKVDTDLMPLTKTGKFQTNKDALLLGVKDKKLLAMLKYRAQLNTCLDTFMIPWLLIAAKSKGFIYTTWNQVKVYGNGGMVGARTGRLSSTPNFQNIPKVFKPLFHHDDPKAKLPKCPFKDLPPLPKCRGYIIPFKGDILIDRDYSQQELRILAHFDGCNMLDAYIEDPWTDMHDNAQAELANIGLTYERGAVKNTNFGIIYGMGFGVLASKNGTTVAEAKTLKGAILDLYPGIKDMNKDMKARARNNEPIRTWGGREYYCEPPKMVDGRLRNFDYKLLNVLVQGSAADCTKEALIQCHEKKHKDTKIILNVHDQITESTPKKLFKKEMEVLKICLESIKFDVPMLSEGKISDTSWKDLKPYDKKGEII